MRSRRLGSVFVFTAVLAGCGGGSFDIGEVDAGGLDDTGATSDASIDTSGDGSDDTTPVADSATSETRPTDSGGTDATIAEVGDAGDAIASDTRDAATDSGAAIDGGDAGPPACVPRLEICNGLDDDCDLQVDDVPLPPSCGIGACMTTPTSACASGARVSCTPGTPVTEICGNGIDDDCNGVVDDGCIVCARYVQLGATGDGLTAITPMGSIQAAITALATTKGNVCVAASFTSGPGTACLPATYTERVTMVEGVSVFGGYKAGALWARGDAACVTTIQDPGNVANPGLGVFFGHALTNATQLDGFTVVAATSTGTPLSTAAITMQSGGKVTNSIINGASAPTSYGVNIVAPSTVVSAPLVARNTITAGQGSANSTGVHVANVQAVLRDNTIRGGASTTTSRGVELDIGARGAIVDGNDIAAGAGVSAIGLRVTGVDPGTIWITRNSIAGGASTSSGTNQESKGIYATGCPAGSGPLNVIGNKSIQGGAYRATGIDLNNCSATIENNGEIVGKTVAGGEAVGIFCNGGGQRCSIAANGTVAGATVSASSARGVIVTGPTALIHGNGSVQGCGVLGPQTCIGIELQGAGPGSVVSGNRIEVSFGTFNSGIRLRYSNARVFNNLVFAEFGIGIEVDNRPNAALPSFEAIVTNNTLIAPSGSSFINDTALLLVQNETSTAVPPSGVFRNNLAVCLGGGTRRWAFREFGATADPRVLTNNVFFGCGTLYGNFDGNVSLTTIAAVDALTDVPVIGPNYSIDPAFVGATWVPAASSGIVDKGTAVDAPSVDFAGIARPAGAAHDPGAHEVP